jgi:phosphocarrier protein HPr
VPVREVQVVNRLGLHARPAAMFVRTTGRFESEVFVCKGDVEVNGKSIMGVMMLAAEKGSTLLLRAEGPDAEDVLDALDALISSRFGEEAYLTEDVR